jgi:hypothetical protein
VQSRDSTVDLVYIRRENCIWIETCPLYIILYRRLTIGRGKSESCIRQNSCKMPVKQGFMQSRDAAVDLVYNVQTRSTVQYSEVQYSIWACPVSMELILVLVSVSMDSLTKTPIRVVSKGS